MIYEWDLSILTLCTDKKTQHIYTRIYGFGEKPQKNRWEMAEYWKKPEKFKVTEQQKKPKGLWEPKISGKRFNWHEPM